MSRKKTNLKYKKERCVLSDVLPYEIPVTFSNRHFYEFLLSNHVEFKEGNINWVCKDRAIETAVRLLFGISPAVPLGASTQSPYIKDRTGQPVKISSFRGIKDKDWITIPFGYKISHKEKEYRELTICHPKNQIQVVDFYHRHKELMLYYCSISPFSIRRPQKISKFLYHKDKTHYERLSREPTKVEESDKEYENLRSFFVYKDYSNIYKFYESYKYHRCEKKYNELLKLDVSKCFDSIYTHSLSWALLNKASVKEDKDMGRHTFAGRFDSLMQKLNYNETNGIIIGPEFSRIFAELIMQSVDNDVMHILKTGEQPLIHKVDYEIFRYVDDYFIFYNEDTAKNRILETLQHQLKGYKLYLNINKSITYKKPIITEISIAKQRVVKLLDDKLVYKLEDIENAQHEEQENQKYKKGSINVDSKLLIIQFKTIIKECKVEYKDMLNYTLAVIASKNDQIIKNYHLAAPEHRSEKQLVNATLEILDFVFFIYSVSPKVNTTIKLCRILEPLINPLNLRLWRREFQS